MGALGWAHEGCQDRGRALPPCSGDPGLALRRAAAGRGRGTWATARFSRARPAQRTYLSTSIFRPSTIVPFSFSRARSASELVSKVTNPKPCERRRTGTERKDERKEDIGGVGWGAGQWGVERRGEGGERERERD